MGNMKVATGRLKCFVTWDTRKRRHVITDVSLKVQNAATSQCPGQEIFLLWVSNQIQQCIGKETKIVHCLLAEGCFCFQSSFSQ